MSVGFAPPAPPPQRPPRELLFEFHVARTHKFYRAELLDRGKWGVEAQIIEAPDDVLRPSISGSRASGAVFRGSLPNDTSAREVISSASQASHGYRRVAGCRSL